MKTQNSVSSYENPRRRSEPVNQGKQTIVKDASLLRASTGRLAAAQLSAKQSPWLSRQCPGFQDALLRLACLQSFDKEETIIALDEQGSALCFLLEGAVKVSVASPTLDLVPVHIVSGGAWFGEQCALSRIPSLAEYRAGVHCTALVISHAALTSLRQGLPQAALAFADLLAISLGAQYELAGNLVNNSPEQRVRARLFYLAGIGKPAAAEGPVKIPICQTELAALSAASRSTVCKVLSDLEQRAIVRQGYGQIEVIRHKALEQDVRLGIASHE